MEKIKKIISNMDKTKKNYVVLDCDNTIITGDVERFTLRYQLEFNEYMISLDEIKQRLSKYTKFREDINQMEIKRDFSDMVSKIYLEYGDDVSGFLLTGYTPNEVYDLTTKAIKTYKKEFSKRNYIEKLFKLFRENNIEIYICSASIIHEVYVASDMYGIKRENVLACNIGIENEKLTGFEVGDNTRGFGKVRAINSLGYGYPPLLIAGDTDGDYPMMISFDIEYGMIVNANSETKLYKIVDNKKYFYYSID